MKTYLGHFWGKWHRLPLISWILVLNSTLFPNLNSSLNYWPKNHLFSTWGHGFCSQLHQPSPINSSWVWNVSLKVSHTNTHTHTHPGESECLGYKRGVESTSESALKFTPHQGIHEHTLVRFLLLDKFFSPSLLPSLTLSAWEENLILYFTPSR